MTAQIAEKLKYEGQQLSMCGEPLGDYFALGGFNPGFQYNCSARWRGYVGSWDIWQNRLYLIGLEGTLKDGRSATVEALFPGFPDRVFAHWYSGTVRIPQGKLLQYMHGGYASVYERDLFLEVEKGVVTKTTVIENGKAERDDAPDGYNVGAMTVFNRNDKQEGTT